MIVDDHKTMLWGLEKLIEGEKPGMEVVAAVARCEEAICRIPESKPDVILLDLDLDGQDGLDILPVAVSNQTSKVLIFTGARDQTILDSAVLRGARGIVRKDTGAELLLKAIRAVHRGEMWLEHASLSRVFSKAMKLTTPNKLASEPANLTSLTSRERKIIHTIVEENGAPNKLIAQKLFISEHTLRNHLTSIYQKLGVSNRLELYVYAAKNRLGTPLPNPNARAGMPPGRYIPKNMN